MAVPVRACALIGRFSDPRVGECVCALLPHLKARGVQVLVIEGSELPPPGLDGVVPVPEGEIGQRAGLVIAVGGDGTLLYGARLVARHGVPLLGINRGRLGFLTDILPQDMLGAVDAALDGKLESEQRTLLRATVHAGAASGDPARRTIEALALNDVVLQKAATGRMLDFDVHVNGRYVNTHAGDGIVIATATGSTAYALSCGGPIVEPHLDVVVMAPICPHTLSDRPVVVSARSHVEVRLIERYETSAQVVCDGVVVGDLQPNDLLEVKAAEERITLLHPPGHDYYRLLRSKLQWGRGGRDLSR
ncbi:MAG: NAD(+)/NADH kinase [Steroidobacteraceae bacterium]|nr:NAD(+)/NADH kinase [Steroidobacteraceae bacterium]